MAKTPNSATKATKKELQNTRIQTYQMTCRNCEWKSNESQSRRSVNFAGDEHKRSTRDIKTGKTHRVEMGNVGNEKG